MSAERFERHALLPGWQQEQLSTATVVVMGVGALGNTAAQTLALAGVGRLLLCDMDEVSESNLSRTPLFRPQDVGRPKAEVAATRLRELVPGLVVEPRPHDLVRGVGLAELRDASLVLGCLDSRAARIDLAGRCTLVGARLIDAGTSPWGGEVRPYLDPAGPCFACGLTPQQRAEIDRPRSCLDPAEPTPVGASQPISALMASWQAVWAVRALMNLPVPPQTLVIDASTSSTATVAQTRDPSCPLHEPLPIPRLLELDANATVESLRAQVGPHANPLAWAPIQCRVCCPAGHVDEPRWRAPSAEPCPTCGRLLRTRTTLSLRDAPATARLSDLGIAPGEILVIDAASGTSTVELHHD